MNEFQGTFVQELVKNVILSFSGLGLGCALYLSVRDIRRALRVTSHLRRYLIARALFTACFVGVLALLSLLIWQSHRPLTLNWQSAVYTVLVVGAALGALGMAWEARKLRKEPHP